jgi:hypothetical protein
VGTIERTSSVRVIKLGASVSVTVPLTEGLGRHLPVIQAELGSVHEVEGAPAAAGGASEHGAL